jgi:hypothetical protein
MGCHFDQLLQKFHDQFSASTAVIRQISFSGQHFSSLLRMLSCLSLASSMGWRPYWFDDPEKNLSSI